MNHKGSNQPKEPQARSFSRLRLLRGGKGPCTLFAKAAGKGAREWSGPTQPPHTRSKHVKRIPCRLLPSHGEARAKEPRHRISGEQAVLELQARALLGLLVAFTSGGEGELRLGDHDLVHFMTTAGESQSNRGHLLLSQRSAAKPLQQARLEASRSF